VGEFIPQAQDSSQDGRDKLALSDNKDSWKNMDKDTKSRNLLFLINQSDSREVISVHVTICKIN